MVCSIFALQNFTSGTNYALDLVIKYIHDARYMWRGEILRMVIDQLTFFWCNVRGRAAAWCPAIHEFPTPTVSTCSMRRERVLRRAFSFRQY